MQNPITSAQLLEKVRRPSFSLGKYAIISQQPTVISQADLVTSAERYLPAFIATWQAVEKATGYRWKNTSYIRDSPSHQLGQAFDLAPDIAPQAEKHYAVYKGSDPVLYKRRTLIERLKTIVDTTFPGCDIFDIGVFIEPDHLHLQVFRPAPGPRKSISIITWPVPKPVYSDTYERMKIKSLP